MGLPMRMTFTSTGTGVGLRPPVLQPYISPKSSMRTQRVRSARLSAGQTPGLVRTSSALRMRKPPLAAIREPARIMVKSVV